MSASLKPSEARAIRKHYEPKFLKSLFNLQCPKIDHSIARKMGERKERQEVAKVEQKEKSLISIQYKVLDVARPLLFMTESLVADPTRRTLWTPATTLCVSWDTPLPALLPVDARISWSSPTQNFDLFCKRQIASTQTSPTSFSVVLFKKKVYWGSLSENRISRADRWLGFSRLIPPRRKSLVHY